MKIEPEDILFELEKLKSGEKLVIEYSDINSDYEKYCKVIKKLQDKGYTVIEDSYYPSGYLGYRAATKYTTTIYQK